jgi:hypothetical protein
MLYPKPIRKPRPRRPSRGDLRAHVISRDRGCILRSSQGHVCKGRDGKPPTRDSDYTLEHVPAVHGPSDVRRDDPAHCVGLCYGTNVKPPSTDEREIMRRKLRSRYPNCVPND